MSDKRLRLFIYYPIILSLVLAGGIYLGSRLNVSYLYDLPGADATDNSRKITNLLNYVMDEYVDTVDLDGLTESTIISMLDQLDPHSAYIPARELQAMNEPLNGNFDGIGVEFNIINDTIVVVAPISGGPSEKLGIRSGDRIVMIEDSVVAGVGIQNQDVISKLRGERGSKVHISIFRRGLKGLQQYTIVRDKIPIYSVDAAYLMEGGVGYIKVSRFAATTYDEFKEKLDAFRRQGMQKLIIDLRGNPGGYLTAAIEMCDEVLSEGQLIVYTEGRSRPKESSFATSRGSFEKGAISILIDEGSASASEIVAGAIQDNDRGVIVGRRSFGKGLVQEQVELPDGSAVRLTIARYYTPTGRSIQRPYENTEQYYHDLYERYEHGELYEADSVSLNKNEKFVTPKGKVVYGGGGIMPDVFVPLDTTNYSAYHNRLVGVGAVREFALELSTRHAAELKKFKTVDEFRKQFRVSAAEFAELVELGRKQGVKATDEQVKRAENAIRQNLRALIARSLWNGEGYYPIINEDDTAIRAALDAMK